MQPVIRITTEGVPMWTDAQGGVHNPTQFRSFREAEHVPVPNIRYKIMRDPFTVDGDPTVYGPGDVFAMIDGKAVGLTAADFAAQWEPTGKAA